MRKSLFVIAGMGLVGMVVLSMLMSHYLGVNPRIRAVLDLRELCLSTPGLPERLVTLSWAPPAAVGEKPQGLRAVFRPMHGPNAAPKAKQAQDLGEFLLKQWGERPEVPRPKWVDVKGITDGPDFWQRVTKQPDWAPPVAPPGASGYSPPPPAPAPSPAPGEKAHENKQSKQS